MKNHMVNFLIISISKEFASCCLIECGISILHTSILSRKTSRGNDKRKANDQILSNESRSRKQCGAFRSPGRASPPIRQRNWTAPIDWMLLLLLGFQTRVWKHKLEAQGQIHIAGCPKVTFRQSFHGQSSHKTHFPVHQGYLCSGATRTETFLGTWWW